MPETIEPEAIEAEAIEAEAEAIEAGAEAIEAAAIDAAAVKLAAASRVWIGTHQNPDGDAVGSLLGLGWILDRRGTEVTLACQDPPPEGIDFLPGADRIRSVPPGDQDLLVAVDAGDAERLGDIHVPDLWSEADTLVIDHHASNPGFGRMNLVDPSAASTAEMIVRIAGTMEADLAPPVGTCLLTGILTDTLGFRTSNTGAETLRLAAQLVDAGASLPDLSQRIFATRPLPTMRLLGLAVERMEVRDGLGLAWLTLADFHQYDATSEHARGIANFLAEAEPLRAVALLKERPEGGVDLSMRSRPGTNLIPVAQLVGGGGHPQASGARLETTLDVARDRVWSALEAELGQ